MAEPSSRSWQVFLDVFEHLPRQGPGNRASTARALALCADLTPAPAIVDLGCGVGAQTLDLATLTDGSVVAVDDHGPFLERLAVGADALGLTDRVRPLCADMAATGLRPASFDLVWSEGALYQIGLENALRICAGLLHPGGHLAFTDAVWRRDDPPAEVRACFGLDYPTMGTVDDDLAVLARCGFEPVDHFTLPDEAWWQDFYTPMQARVRELRQALAGDREALDVLDGLDAEAELHRRHGDSYAYEFFVSRRASDG
jgi:SAM-dependent methyltransferase